jgi:hypothetical protein
MHDVLYEYLIKEKQDKHMPSPGMLNSKLVVSPAI